MDYDFIVVGGGTAGCIIASRLAQSKFKVLLLESGYDPDTNKDISDVRKWSKSLGTKYDYDYTIEPQLRANSNIRYSRGKMLGGCSSHNSCIAFKTPDFDLEEWVKNGAIGWDPQNIKKYFDTISKSINIESAKIDNLFIDDVFQAAHHAGISAVDFKSEGVIPGIGWFDLNKKGYNRESSVKYLDFNLNRRKPHKYLKIYTEVTVNKIIFDGSRAIGVESTYGKYYSNYETIICCGAINTPKLLLLSGIGPKEHLDSVCINTIVDLPGVGSNLLDHPEGVINWESNTEISPEFITNWEVGIFANSRNSWSNSGESQIPDIMMHLGTVIFDMNTLKCGYPTANKGFCLTPNVCRAKSTGTIKLRSNNPKDTPMIDLNYFTDKNGHDEAVLIEGFKLARKIVSQDPLKKWIKRELTPGTNVNSDEEISDYLRKTCNTVYHAAGTCKMGFSSDPLSVVNHELKVKGIVGLRVADASIFPTMIGVNPALTIMMIGEKCADLIIQELINDKKMIPELKSKL